MYEKQKRPKISIFFVLLVSYLKILLNIFLNEACFFVSMPVILLFSAFQCGQNWMFSLTTITPIRVELILCLQKELYLQVWQEKFLYFFLNRCWRLAYFTFLGIYPILIIFNPFWNYSVGLHKLILTIISYIVLPKEITVVYQFFICISSILIFYMN